MPNPPRFHKHRPGMFTRPKPIRADDRGRGPRYHRPMTSKAVEPPPRRTGRPRADARVVVGDPTDEILAATGRLIGELGIGGTAMSRIATEVGLKQSSLYYYFRRKEEIVAALVARANVVPLELIRTIVADGGSAPAQLYRFVRADVVALCALPFDINEVHRIAARDTDGFAAYWKERSVLERRLAGIIRAGIGAGTLRSVDPRLTALTILANDEGTQNWFRLGSRWSAKATGAQVADLVVTGLATDAGSLADVVAEADTLDADD